MFITFEGLDFCGKSTQIELLKNFLENENKETLVIREPGGTEISEKIREILLDKKNSGMTSETELLLFYASRAQLFKQVIEPNLKRGVFVLSDRFYDSSTAYQGYGRGLDIDFIKALNKFALNNKKPDLTFFIDLPLEKLNERKLKHGASNLDRIETSDEDFYKRVRRGYLDLANECERIKVIDGTRSIEEVSKEIISVVSSHPSFRGENEK